MADLRRVLERELAQVRDEVGRGHRVLRHGQGDGRGGLGRRAALRHRQVGELLEQVAPDREHAGREVVGLLGGPGEVGNGRRADRHRQTLEVDRRGYVPGG